MIFRITVNKEDAQRTKQLKYGQGRESFFVGLDKIRQIDNMQEIMSLLEQTEGFGKGQITVDIDNATKSEIDAMATRFNTNRARIGRIIMHLGLPELEPEPEPVQDTAVQELQELLTQKEAQLQEQETRIKLMNKTLKYLQWCINTGQENGTMLFEIKRALARE